MTKPVLEDIYIANFKILTELRSFYLPLCLLLLVICLLFTARRNAGIASAVLAIAIPSVRLSVTRRYCVKTTARSTVQFALLDG